MHAPLGVYVGDAHGADHPAESYQNKHPVHQS